MRGTWMNSWKRGVGFLLGVLAIWGSHASPVAWAKKIKLMTYIVQPGDSCWSIAQRLYNDPRKYKIIYRYNKHLRPPALLKPGEKLRLPATKLPDARLVRMSKKVLAKPPNSVDWHKAKQNMGLWNLYKVSTKEKASATLLFKDTSRLRMRENALVVIYGKGVKSIKKKQTKTRVVVREGIVRGGLSKLFKDAGIDIETPAGRVKLGGSGQVEVDKKKRSTISVFKGSAIVRAKGKKVRVPGNYGTFVKKGKPPEKPRKLPQPPAWKSKGERLFLFVPKGFKESFSLVWSPVQGAKRYHVEVASDPNFKQVILDLLSEGETIKVRAERLGVYYARVSAIDQIKLESRPSTTMQVHVSELKSSRRLFQYKGTYEMAGIVKLAAPGNLGSKVEVAVGKEKFRTFSAPLRLFKIGEDIVRFRAVGKPSTEVRMKVRVLAMKSDMKAPKRPLELNGKSAEILLKIRDERGRVAVPPGLKVVAYPGGPLKFDQRTPGNYRILLPAPEKYIASKIVVRASWLGGDLVEKSVLVKKPPAPPVKKPPPPMPKYRWKHHVPGLDWSSTGQIFASRTATPHSFVGLDTSWTQIRYFKLRDDGTRESIVNSSGAQAPTQMLRYALRAGYSFLGGRLGVDGVLPFHSELNGSQTNASSSLGNFSLGLRFAFLSNEKMTLSFSLRGTLQSLRLRDNPTQNASEARVSLLYLDPGLLVRWSPVSWLALRTNQMFVFGTGAAWGTELFWSSNYGFSLHFGSFSWTSELALALGFAGASAGITEMAASTGIFLHFGHVRVGLVGGMGLGEPNNLVALALGEGFSIGLKFDVGFWGR